MRLILWIDEKVGIVPAVITTAIILTIIGILGSLYESQNNKKDTLVWKTCVKRTLDKKWGYADIKQYCLDHVKEWKVILKNESKKNRKTTRVPTKSVSQ